MTCRFTKPIREVLADCLVRPDFFVTESVIIRKDEDTLPIEDPGYFRTGRGQMLEGGTLDDLFRQKVVNHLGRILPMLLQLVGMVVAVLVDFWISKQHKMKMLAIFQFVDRAHYKTIPLLFDCLRRMVGARLLRIFFLLAK